MAHRGWLGSPGIGPATRATNTDVRSRKPATSVMIPMPVTAPRTNGLAMIGPSQGSMLRKAFRRHNNIHGATVSSSPASIRYAATRMRVTTRMRMLQATAELRARSHQTVRAA